MRKTFSVTVIAAALFALATVNCGDDGSEAGPLLDGGAEAEPFGEGGAGTEKDNPLVPATKVDLLFVVDNSASMGDKQALLQTSVGRILRRLIEPSCVDAKDKTKLLGPSQAGGCGAGGVLEHAPVHDLPSG